MAESDWRAIAVPLLKAAGYTAPIERIVPLTGGVSSDIVRIDLASGQQLCAKRALPRLKVASVWEAPLERNHFEVAWLRIASDLVPHCAPTVLGEDQTYGVALLEFLPPQDYRLWKSELLAGRFDPSIPQAVATTLARIHAATWADREIAAQFKTDAMFDALRLSPYLRTLAERTPDLADKIMPIVERTATHRLALVHGDVSPKNILVSNKDDHPVMLDAECAWFGDPAFDAAFCANHLILKSFHLPAIRERLLQAAEAFVATWQAGLPAASQADAEARTASLLPCLMLARIDGKSPVEYLDEPTREAVRRASRPMIADPPASVAGLVASLRANFARPAR
jgi:hypothetical protein